MEELIRIVVLAFLVEATWETLKLAYDKDKVNISTIGALVTGLVVALSVNFDILLLLGFTPAVPFVGVVLTGILISRGGNFVHELIKKLQGGNNG